MKGFPDLPPIWAAVFAALSILAAKLIPILSLDVLRFLAWPLIILGFGLIMWSAYFFLSKRTPIEPHHTPSSLIVEGPYRISRNPIYLGLFLGVLGVACWSAALTSVIVVFAFPFVIKARFILAEEAALKQQFGSQAEAYFASTGRWITGLSI